MAETTGRDVVYVIEYKPTKKAEWMPWLLTFEWSSLKNAEQYLAGQRVVFPDLFGWRIVEQVTTTTVTREVIA
jgi:hypothetical protein